MSSFYGWMDGWINGVCFLHLFVSVCLSVSLAIHHQAPVPCLLVFGTHTYEVMMVNFTTNYHKEEGGRPAWPPTYVLLAVFASVRYLLYLKMYMHALHPHVCVCLVVCGCGWCGRLTGSPNQRLSGRQDTHAYHAYFLTRWPGGRRGESTFCKMRIGWMDGWLVGGSSKFSSLHACCTSVHYLSCVAVRPASRHDAALLLWCSGALLLFSLLPSLQVVVTRRQTNRQAGR
mmetsp:Transcript_47226/g.117879  ORF Transcript_47226/g.117879 Transcript_47226/m.117879 type:complete len:230 (-) Transcript_47226:16-705(-)